MRKTYIIVSQVCDAFIANNRPDIDFILFKNLEELLGFVEREYLTADVLYVTRDVVQPNYTNKLSILLDIVQSPMFKVDSIIYLADEKNCAEVNVLESLKNSYDLKTWEYHKGPMNKEYITAYICGSLTVDEVDPVRRAVVRKKKKDYVRENLLHEEEMSRAYDTEEVMLSDVVLEDMEKVKDVPVIKRKDICKIVNVTGLKRLERTLFSFLLSQYSSRSSKTIIIEKDFEYLRLSDMVSRTDLKLMNITVQELYKDTKNVLNAIRNCKENLITITASDRGDYPYAFICDLLYTTLKDVVEFIIVEHELIEVPLMSKYLVVIPSNIVDVMETIDKIPESYKNYSSMVVVNTSIVEDLCVSNTIAISKVLQEYLNYDKKLDIPIFNLNSLVLGENCHDLYSYLHI